MPAAKRVRLTKTLIAQLEHRPSRYFVMDSEVPGLGVRVNADSKSFVIVTGGRDRRREVLCPVGQLTLDEAREAARKRLGATALQDLLPVFAPPTALVRQGPTFGDLVDNYERWAVSHGRRALKHNQYRIELHLKGWRDRDAFIPRGEFLALAAELGERSHAEANLILKLSRRIYSVAESSGLITFGTNPLLRLGDHLYEDPERHDRSASPAEILRLRNSIWQIQRPSVRALLWLLLLTGLRKSEAMRLRWEFVNLSDQEGTLPGRRKFPGRSYFVPKNKANRPVVLPLSTTARELLMSLSRGGTTVGPSGETVLSVSRSEWVFPDDAKRVGFALAREEGGPVTSLKGIWERARKRAKCPELNLHDLRATVATMMANADVHDRVIALCLNQRPPAAVVNRYIDDTPDRMRKALEDHGQRILDAAEVEHASVLVWREMASGAKILQFG